MSGLLHLMSMCGCQELKDTNKQASCLFLLEHLPSLHASQSSEGCEGVLKRSKTFKIIFEEQRIRLNLFFR